MNILGNYKDENLSVLRLIKRSINKNFGNFKMFLSNLNFSFYIICFFEAWLNDSKYELPNYVSVYQIRNHYKRFGSQYIFIKVSNWKSEMILGLIIKTLNQSVWNVCVKKRGALYLMLSINHPTTKKNHLKTF